MTDQTPATDHRLITRNDGYACTCGQLFPVANIASASQLQSAVRAAQAHVDQMRVPRCQDPTTESLEKLHKEHEVLSYIRSRIVSEFGLPTDAPPADIVQAVIDLKSLVDVRGRVIGDMQSAPTGKEHGLSDAVQLTEIWKRCGSPTGKTALHAVMDALSEEHRKHLASDAKRELTEIWTLCGAPHGKSALDAVRDTIRVLAPQPGVSPVRKPPSPRSCDGLKNPFAVEITMRGTTDHAGHRSPDRTYRVVVDGLDVRVEAAEKDRMGGMRWTDMDPCNIGPLIAHAMAWLAQSISDNVGAYPVSFDAGIVTGDQDDLERGK